jgi:hypothetical protein
MPEILETRILNLGLFGVALVALVVLQRLLSWKRVPKGTMDESTHTRGS